VGVTREVTALDSTGASLRGEQILELVFGLRLLRIVVKAGIVEDDPRPLLLPELQQQSNQIGLVQVVGEDVDR